MAVEQSSSSDGPASFIVPEQQGGEVALQQSQPPPPPEGAQPLSLTPLPSPPESQAGTAVVLGPGSSVIAMRERLKQLGAPVYGTKPDLWKRLVQYESEELRKKKEREYFEERRAELAAPADPVEQKLVPGTRQPTAEERERHTC